MPLGPSSGNPSFFLPRVVESLGVDGHCGGAPVQPFPQPVREPLRSPLRPCLPGTSRDELPPESLLYWSLEGQATASVATSVSLSNSDLTCTLW